MPLMEPNTFVQEFTDYLKSSGFRPAGDNSYYLRESPNYWSLVSLDIQNGAHFIRYGVRPHEDFQHLGRCLQTKLPAYVKNPFFEKWCSLVWMPLIPEFSVYNSRKSWIKDLLYLLKLELSIIRDSQNSDSLGKLSRLTWQTKQFDGLSRYTLVFMLLRTGQVNLATQAVRYFSLMQPPDQQSSYRDKLDDITKCLEIDSDIFSNIFMPNGESIA